MYKNISYFLLDVRANQSSRAWVPWSIDSFEKYSTFVYFTCIISSHIRIYLLFSFGCSGEPVRPCVSSLEYRFLWKIHYLRVLYMLISSHVLRYLLFSFGCSGEPVQSCVSSLKYRFLWKIQHIRVLYMHNIISYTYICYFLIWICYFLLDVRANRPDRAWVPWSIDSFEKYTIFVYFTSNIISCTQISLIFFWMFGRTSPVVREFPEV